MTVALLSVILALAVALSVALSLVVYSPERVTMGGIVVVAIAWGCAAGVLSVVILR